jgi:ABC-2 type transport system ATP-binding protein
MAAAGLEGLENRLFGKLSGGQKQRVLFALALCGDPDLLFLDEPTVGLDVESRRAFWSVIEEKAGQGRSVLLTTHYLEEADALADRIVLISKGRTSLPLEEVAALPGVRSARRDGELTELFAAEAERAVRELLDRDPRLSGLEVRGADLEEAFLTLTHSGVHEEVAA